MKRKLEIKQQTFKYCKVISCIKCDEGLPRRHRAPYVKLSATFHDLPCSPQSHHCVKCIMAVYQGEDCGYIDAFGKHSEKCHRCNILRCFQQKKEKRSKKEEKTIEVPSLLELCVKMLVHFPQSIMLLSSCGLSNHFWDMVHKHISKLNRKEILNLKDDKAMFRALAKYHERLNKN